MTEVAEEEKVVAAVAMVAAAVEVAVVAAAHWRAIKRCMACTDTMFKDRHNATFNIFAAYRWLKQLGPGAGSPPPPARGSKDVASPGTHFLKGHRRPFSSR